MTSKRAHSKYKWPP